MIWHVSVCICIRLYIVEGFLFCLNLTNPTTECGPTLACTLLSSTHIQAMINVSFCLFRLRNWGCPGLTANFPMSSQLLPWLTTFCSSSMPGTQVHRMQLSVDHHCSRLAGSLRVCIGSWFWPHTASQTKPYIHGDGQASTHLVAEISDENQDVKESRSWDKLLSHWYCQRQTTGLDNT